MRVLTDKDTAIPGTKVYITKEALKKIFNEIDNINEYSYGIITRLIEKNSYDNLEYVDVQFFDKNHMSIRNWHCLAYHQKDHESWLEYENGWNIADVLKHLDELEDKLKKK